MGRKYREEKELRDILREIEVPVIVEGKKDEEALSRAGVRKIIRIDGMGLYEFALGVSQRHEEVIVLTDFDREGSKIAGKLNLLLGSLGCRVDRKKRALVKREAVRRGVSQIESLWV